MRTSTNPSTKSASFVRTMTVLAAFLLGGLLVIGGSRAAFTDNTNNSANSLAAGTVTLTDDDSDSAIFNVTGMVPGQAEVECILVTYSGTVADPSAVKLYSGGYTDSGNFADYLNVTIEEGTGAVSGDCSSFNFENFIETGGTMSDLDNDHFDYGSGAGVWNPASTPESKAYRVTFELNPLTPDAEQGESVTDLVLMWEVQS